MSLPRCPHGVYNPKGDGEPSDRCSVCTPPVPLTLAEEAYMRLMTQPKTEYCETEIIEQEP
jgi:hypothetical protein